MIDENIIQIKLRVSAQTKFKKMMDKRISLISKNTTVDEQEFIRLFAEAICATDTAYVKFLKLWEGC